SGSDVDERNYFNMYMATSPDGITWTDHGMVLGKGDNDTTESLGLMNGKVIKTPDNTYKMYYTAYDGMVWRLHLAISDDGINWVRKGLILDNGPAGSDDYEKLTEPFVIYHRDTYFMWYTGYPMAGKTVICFATSLDGENWTKQGMVVDSSIVTDSIRVGGANVIIDDDGLIKLWYYGFDGYLHLIHYATMQSHSFHYLNEGELTSEIIDIPNNKVWTSLNISKTDIDADNAITVSIQDADTGEIIDGFLNLTTEIIDLTGINYLDHPNIQLTARFTSDGTDTPILHSWELTMSDDTTDYITIQTKTGEAVHFNCSHTFDNDDIANCTWTFEYNRSTTTLYGEDCRFHFWTPGNYSVILKITDSLGIEKRSKVLVDVSENGVHSDIMDYIWLSVLITAMVLVGMAFMLRNRGSSPSGGVAQEEQEAILDGSPVNIIENIEQRYAEGAISETTYLKLKDKYSEEDE
ncbi:MAG: hypothetical protein KAS16_04235, partial [Thermoplasmata archaeon]|nr:hypothetical protein [Thermoplasmata archaeon]